MRRCAKNAAVGRARGALPANSRGTVELALTLPGEGARSAAVYELLGRRADGLADGLSIGVEDTHTLRVDASRLPAGVYVVRSTIRTAGGTDSLTQTFTVVR